MLNVVLTAEFVPDILLPMNRTIVGYIPCSKAGLQLLKYVGGILETACRGFIDFFLALPFVQGQEHKSCLINLNDNKDQ